MDITETLAPKSDQLNAEDMLTAPRTVTVEKVTRGTAEQPVEIHLVEFPGRPFKPSKTVRRLIVAAWGAEAAEYTGRRMTLFRDETVRFGGSAVGGIRVSHLSHIDKPLTISLTETRGKRKAHRIEPLADAPPPPAPAASPASLPERIDKMLTAFKGIGVYEDQIETHLGKTRDQWEPADLDDMAALISAIKRGDMTAGQAFPDSASEQGELL